MVVLRDCSKSAISFAIKMSKTVVLCEVALTLALIYGKLIKTFVKMKTERVAVFECLDIR